MVGLVVQRTLAGRAQMRLHELACLRAMPRRRREITAANTSLEEGAVAADRGETVVHRDARLARDLRDRGCGVATPHEQVSGRGEHRAAGCAACSARRCHGSAGRRVSPCHPPGHPPDRLRCSAQPGQHAGLGEDREAVGIPPVLDPPACSQPGRDVDHAEVQRPPAGGPEERTGRRAPPPRPSAASTSPASTQAFSANGQKAQVRRHGGGCPDGRLDVRDGRRACARRPTASTRSVQHSSSTIASSPVEKPSSNMRRTTRTVGGAPGRAIDLHDIEPNYLL